jgi:hypothetical protein
LEKRERLLREKQSRLCQKHKTGPIRRYAVLAPEKPSKKDIRKRMEEARREYNRQNPHNYMSKRNWAFYMERQRERVLVDAVNKANEESKRNLQEGNKPVQTADVQQESDRLSSGS